jgi:hypothetical protein
VTTPKEGLRRGRLAGADLCGVSCGRHRAEQGGIGQSRVTTWGKGGDADVQGEKFMLSVSHRVVWWVVSYEIGSWLW